MSHGDPTEASDCDFRDFDHHDQDDDEEMQIAWAVAASTEQYASQASAAATPSASFPLAALPFDLIAAVHSFLDASTLLTGVANTAKDMRDMIREDAQLWRDLCARRFRLPPHEMRSDDAADDIDEASETSPSASEWFRDRSSASLPSSTFSPDNPWLRTYRSFALTPVRPLRLRVLHVVDDERWRHGQLGDDVAAMERRVYGVGNLLRPDGKAYCSSRNRNVHIVLALAPSRTETQSPAAAAASDLTTPLLGAEPSIAALSATAAAAAASSSATVDPLPPSFLMTDFKICAPGSGYTSPLSAGLLFFCDALPTPAQIAAWDDWSEHQWADRQQALQQDAVTRVDHEQREGIERGDAEVQPMEDEGQQVESWYADTLQARTSTQPVLDAFPLQFAEPAELSSAEPPAHVAPLVAFFRLEDNGVVLQSPPTPMVAAASSPATTSSAASSSSASASPAPAGPAAAPQTPYAYRHHFDQPVYGRFIVLTLLRASLEQTNIDVSCFGVKGYRRGMHAAQSVTVAQTSSATTEPSQGAPTVDPDAAEDAFDFDAPLLSNSDVTSRLRAHLQALQRMGHGMAHEVAIMDAHLERVQTAVHAQQVAQQHQQQLRLRMLMLQTQQLQLQLQNQHVQTRRTLADAQQLNDRASSFMDHRREVLSAVETEREVHRQRLQQLTEEKEREESMLHTLRARVREAQERELSLREQLHRNQAARDLLDQASPSPSPSDLEAERVHDGGQSDSHVGASVLRHLPSFSPPRAAFPPQSSRSPSSVTASSLLLPTSSLTPAPSISASAYALSSRTSDLLARLRDSRLQREAESRAIFDRMHARRVETTAAQAAAAADAAAEQEEDQDHAMEDDTPSP